MKPWRRLVGDGFATERATRPVDRDGVVSDSDLDFGRRNREVRNAPEVGQEGTEQYAEDIDYGERHRGLERRTEWFHLDRP